MSPRGRVFLIVALAAVLVSGAVVAGVLATRSSVPSVKPRKGLPPLALDLGVRTDPEARGLRQGLRLYQARRTKQAGEAFGRYHSLEAEIGAAFAAWPSGSLERLRTLAAAHPHSSLAAVNLGDALYWSRQNAEALSAWRAAARLQPDSYYAVYASNLLHPKLAPWLPVFVQSFREPRGLSGLSPPQQLALLRRDAARGGAHAKILYGVALQRLYHQRSAERQFAAAARDAPDDPDARVAAAVGLFDKANPSLAFGRLGPLVRVFPHAQTVRFHLGVLLLWIDQIGQARKELQQAHDEDPSSTLGKESSVYLSALRMAGTG